MQGAISWQCFSIAKPATDYITTRCTVSVLSAICNYNNGLADSVVDSSTMVRVEVVRPLNGISHVMRYPFQ